MSGLEGWEDDVHSRKEKNKVMEFGRIGTACLAMGKHHNTTIWTFCWTLRVLHQSAPRTEWTGRSRPLCCHATLSTTAYR
jgi:hypothetical protein